MKTQPTACAVDVSTRKYKCYQFFIGPLTWAVAAVAGLLDVPHAFPILSISILRQLHPSRNLLVQSKNKLMCLWWWLYLVSFFSRRDGRSQSSASLLPSPLHPVVSHVLIHCVHKSLWSSSWPSARLFQPPDTEPKQCIHTSGKEKTCINI